MKRRLARAAVVCALLAPSALGCTESPGYLPPCADPQVECPPLDAGEAGAEGGKAKDAAIDVAPTG